MALRRLTAEFPGLAGSNEVQQYSTFCRGEEALLSALMPPAELNIPCHVQILDPSLILQVEDILIVVEKIERIAGHHAAVCLLLAHCPKIHHQYAAAEISFQFQPFTLTGLIDVSYSHEAAVAKVDIPQRAYAAVAYDVAVQIEAYIYRWEQHWQIQASVCCERNMVSLFYCGAVFFEQIRGEHGKVDGMRIASRNSSDTLPVKFRKATIDNVKKKIFVFVVEDDGGDSSREKDRVSAV